MIVGSLKQEQQQAQLAHPALDKAAQYLTATDFASMEDGKYSIVGEEMYALLMTLTSKPAAEQPAEQHQCYTDLHYLLEGQETIGWKRQDGTEIPTQAYNSDKDFALYGELKDETMVKLQPGMFAVLFPEDLHRPGLTDSAPSHIRKVVIKIHQDLLKV